MKQKMQWRILGLFCLCLTLCVGLMTRTYLLCMDGGLRQAAHRQSSYRLEIGRTRGKIYDRNLLPLVDIEKVNRLAVIPTELSASDCARQITGIDRRQVLDQILEGKPFLYDLPETEKVYSPQVENFSVSHRLAYNKEERFAQHLIGYLDGEGKGVCGLEKSFQEELYAAGDMISVRCRIDARGMAAGDEPMEIQGNPRSGKGGIVLTLDRRIQGIVETVGEEQIAKGAVVVMKAGTGEIAASASFPQYDPYELGAAVKDEELSLLNRALMPYCVGSSFKLVTAAAALEQGISPEMTNDCVGVITVANRPFYCHYRAGHREMNLRKAIEESCNPYFIRLGEQVGGERLLGMANALGFGKGSELAEGIQSLPGTLPTKAQLKSPHELANLSFGQGKLTATPVQITAMVNTVISGGLYYPPQLILGKSHDGGKIVLEQQNAPRKVFSKTTADYLKQAMIGVVEEGSAPMAKPKRGGAGGKTASAQTGIYDKNEKEIVHAWFTGFFPAKEPEYVVTVLVEGGEYGGKVAGPIFREIADRIESGHRRS